MIDYDFDHCVLFFGASFGNHGSDDADHGMEVGCGSGKCRWLGHAGCGWKFLGGFGVTIRDFVRLIYMVVEGLLSYGGLSVIPHNAEINRVTNPYVLEKGYEDF